jgi:hypothetical protein
MKLLKLGDKTLAISKQLRKAPKANDGIGPTHGGILHNKKIDDKVQEMNDQGYTDIRKNQKQVDAQGNVVGENRPDLQGTHPDGTRHYIEYDNKKTSSESHGKTIGANDPNGKISLELLPQPPR